MDPEMQRLEKALKLAKTTHDFFDDLEKDALDKKRDLERLPRIN